MQLNEIPRLMQQIDQTVRQVVIDQDTALHQIMVAIVCGGHVLIEDVPGVGKTTLARTLAQLLDLKFRRIQGTPDRLPTEITGSSIWDANSSQFRFIPGPIFGQFVLFDELNRTPAKTQSALLEAMEEGQVTVDGVTYPLPRPFIVLATQNPIELEGTFPLPEAALDRFFARIQLGYPTLDGEKRLLKTWVAPQWRMQATGNIEKQTAILTMDTIFQLRQMVAQIHVADEVIDYLMTIIDATRKQHDVVLGLSPRAGLSIKQAAQTWAAFEGRDFVRPDDIQHVLVFCGAHRMVLTPEAELRRKTPAQILTDVIANTSVPGSWAAATAGADRGGR